jgi:hypothetical protein
MEASIKNQVIGRTSKAYVVFPRNRSPTLFANINIATMEDPLCSRLCQWKTFRKMQFETHVLPDLIEVVLSFSPASWVWGNRYDTMLGIVHY